MRTPARIFFAAVIVLSARAECQAQSDFRVTLLGTGVPIPSPDRFGPCTLVEAGKHKFLIDAGRGATIRLIPILRLSDLRLPNRGARWT